MSKKPSYEELEKKIKDLEAKYKQLKKYEYLDIQVRNTGDIKDELIIDNIFNAKDIQKVQDKMSHAMNVASLITRPDGTPITKPSNFCGLCDIIRNTRKGLEDCYHSDAELETENTKGPTIKPCLRCGLWSAGASIIVNGKHVANWVIGQVRDGSYTEEQIREYAKEIGADENILVEEFKKVPVMSREEFKKKADFLYIMANQLSQTSFNSALNKLMMLKQNNISEKLFESEQRLSNIIMSAPYPLCVHAEDGELIFLNKAWQQLSGYSQKEVPTMHDWLSKVYENPKQVWNEISQTYSISSIIDRGEKYLRAKDGRILLWHFHSAPLGKTNDNRRMVISMASDITEQRANEKELKRREKRYKTYIDLSPISIMVTGKDARFVEVNKATCDLCGYSEEELLNMYIPDIDITEKDVDNIAGFAHLKDYDCYRSETQLRRKDGKIIDVDLSVVVFDEDHYMAFAYDISERKEMEKLVVKHANDVLRINERFTLATDSAGIGVYEYDIVNDVLAWDDNTFRIYGIKKESFEGNYKTWEKMLHPDDIADTNQKARDCIDGKCDFETVFRIYQPDGSLHYIKAYAKLKRDNTGKPIKLIGINYDITLQKQMEKDILRSRNILKQILNSIPQSIVWKDRNSTFLGCNENFSRLTGIKSTDEAPGKKVKDLINISSDEAILYTEEDIQVIESKKPFYHLTRKTNTAFGEIWGDITKVPLTAADGTVYGILTVIDDVTKRVASEEKLKEALNGAKEANRAKSEFLATMSHEIRTPLNGIIGFADVLKSELPIDQLENAENIEEYLHIITQCSESLLAIINDVLTLSSIEAGQFNQSNEAFSPLATFDSIIKIFKFKTDSKGVLLTLGHDNLPFMVEGDNLRLKQILFNIVGNAVKFTDKGKVCIKVSYKDKKLIINVKDTGCGIPEDRLSRVTDPFYQANQSSIRRQGGTGLGLAIVSRILEKLNGRFSIKSKVDEGTEIEVLFPVSELPPGYKEDVEFTLQEDVDISMFEILVLEDDAINVMYLSKILDLTGCKYNIVDSFSELKELCEKGIHPNLALIDIALPDADGFECLDWLRNKYPDEDIKYIVQTAHVLSDKQEMYEKAGFDAYIGKPYTREQLIDTIKSMLANIDLNKLT